MTPRWHPDAEVTITRSGRIYRIEEAKLRVVLHTWEFSSRWPGFYHYPPHLALWPRPFSPTGEAQLRQYIPFNLGAHSIRSTAVEATPHTIQVEIAGRASMVPDYPDEWYRDVADVCRWLIDELGVPNEWADFTEMRYGTDAPQRWDLDTYKAFSGFCGHGHVGRGVDTHWDPGRLDVPRLTNLIGDPMSFPIWKIHGLAEDPNGTWNRFARLFGELGLYGLEGDRVPGDQSTYPPAAAGTQTAYWFDKVANPEDPEWPGFYARRELEFWALASEGA